MSWESESICGVCAMFAVPKVAKVSVGRRELASQPFAVRKRNPPLATNKGDRASLLCNFVHVVERLLE